MIAQAPVPLQDDVGSFATILSKCGFEAPHAQLFQSMVADTLSALSLIPKENLVKELTSFRKTANSTSTPASRRFYLTPNQFNCIQCLRNWTDIVINQGGSAFSSQQINLFDDDWVRSISVEFSNESLDLVPHSDDKVTVPTFDGVNWHEVKEAIVRALQSRRGAAGIPLAYLVRDKRIIYSETDQASSLIEKRIQSQKHSGPLFEKDNRDLYQFLSITFAGTSLSTLINGVTNSNGLKAWESLINNCQGTSYAMEVKNRAKTLLDNSFYDGKSNQFTFAQYYEIHVKAHNMLQALGDEYKMTEEEKIFNFVAHIKEQSLMNTYLANRNNAACQTFNGLYEFMDGGLRILNPLGKGRTLKVNGRNGQRTISSVESGRGNGSRGGYGRGSGGRGHGSNQGRGRGGRGRGRNGGRGRGRGRSNSYSPYNKERKYDPLPPNINVNEYVPQDVIDGLTEAQKNTFYEMRRNPGAANVIASIQTTLASTSTTVNDTNGNPNTESSSSGVPPSQAGRAFGRGPRNA